MTDDPTEATDAADADLVAATSRLRAEREAVEARNRELERLVARRAALAARLADALADARAERGAVDAARLADARAELGAIDADLAAVLAAG